MGLWDKDGPKSTNFFADLWNTLVVAPTEALTGVTASKESSASLKEMMDQSLAFQEEQLGIQRELLDPYVQAGAGALQQQQALSGLLGPEAQAAAYQSIQMSPGFQSALDMGETSILQNAAATGGLRGGNTQAALAQFAPQMLQSAIDQRYGQLGGLTGLGQASAAGVGAAGTGSGIPGTLEEMGRQQAADILGQYNLQKNFLMDVAGLATNLFF